MAADRTTGLPFATRSEVIARNGMVATAHPLATQTGLEILKSGGNAIDAAIAANAALGLMEPTSCGIGGDLFAMVWDAGENRLHGLNASGRSPAALSIDLFREHGLDRIPRRGPLPVSVPGCVDGWFEMHRRFGTLPFDQLLEPTIHYAKTGFPVTEVIAAEWASELESLGHLPGFAQQFSCNGRAPAAGDTWRNVNLASTLEAIGRGGRDAFYRGDIAAAVGQFMKSNGGWLTAGDLAAHRSEWVQPVSTTYRGAEVWELPPNGQGIAVLQMLNLLEPFDLGAEGFGSVQHLHLLVEAKKLAYEDRARFYADPDFAAAPVDRLISKEYARRRGSLIDPGSVLQHIEPDDSSLSAGGDTTYLATADSHGNMVSLIQSNYCGMGSGMAPGDLGFVLQNRGELFSLDPRHANCLEPAKRPFHTIIPGFVSREGEPWLNFGVMGGDMQPQGHVQIILNLLDFGMNLQEAGDAPRLYHEGSSTPVGDVMAGSGLVCVESGISPDVLAQLSRLGHRFGEARGVFGGYQAIAVNPDNGALHGASESRKDGQAAGF